jgi:hypothetical protein
MALAWGISGNSGFGFSCQSTTVPIVIKQRIRKQGIGMLSIHISVPIPLVLRADQNLAATVRYSQTAFGPYWKLSKSGITLDMENMGWNSCCLLPRPAILSIGGTDARSKTITHSTTPKT